MFAMFLQTDFVFGRCLFYQMKITCLMQHYLVHSLCTHLCCNFCQHSSAILKYSCFSGNNQTHNLKSFLIKWQKKNYQNLIITNFLAHYFTYRRSFDQIILNIVIELIYNLLFWLNCHSNIYIFAPFCSSLSQLCNIQMIFLQWQDKINATWHDFKSSESIWECSDPT